MKQLHDFLRKYRLEGSFFPQHQCEKAVREGSKKLAILSTNSRLDSFIIYLGKDSTALRKAV